MSGRLREKVSDIVSDHQYSLKEFLDGLEDSLGDILNELQNTNGDIRDDVDLDNVIRMIGQLKDDLY